MNPALADYWHGKRVIVTGGNGFIGQHVVNLGLSLGAEVYSFARSNSESSAHHIHCDFANPPDFQPILAEIQADAVFHLAASGVRDKTDLDHILQVNVLGFKDLLQTFRSLEQAPVVVATGSWFEYQASDTPLTESYPVFPDTAYTLSKLMSHDLVRHMSQWMPTIYLRLFNVYGVGESEKRLLPYLIDCALNNRSADLSPGEQVRDFAYVTDVAEAFYRIAMQHDEGHRVLNVGTGIGHSLKQCVSILSDLLAENDYQLQVNFGILDYRPNDVMYSVADTTNLQATLNWTPSTSLKTGLQAMIDEALAK